MKRFADIITEHKHLMGKRAGLDGFQGVKCSLCGGEFDFGDARIWTRETGKAHYRCYAEWRKKQ